MPEFQRDRGDCPGFIPWVPALSPAEHRAMVDRQWMLKHEQEVREIIWQREDARDKAMRAREDARDSAMSRREDQRDDTTKAREDRKHRNELIVFGAVLGLLTLLAATTEGGWFSRPW